jgi:hypothetical protein
MSTTIGSNVTRRFIEVLKNWSNVILSNSLKENG